MPADRNDTVFFEIDVEGDPLQNLHSRLSRVAELYVAHLEDTFDLAFDLVAATEVDPWLVAHQLEDLVRGAEKARQISHDPAHDFKVEDQLLHEEQIGRHLANSDGAILDLDG